jgi:hypothetical protein
MANLGLEKQRGGMTVYYTAPYDKKTKITAFKPVGPSILYPYSTAPSALTDRYLASNILHSNLFTLSIITMFPQMAKLLIKTVANSPSRDFECSSATRHTGDPVPTTMNLKA